MNFATSTRRQILCRAFAGVMIFAASVPAVAQEPPRRPLVTVTDITVNSVVVEAGQLVANATVTLDIVGRQVTRDVAIPLSLGGTAGPDGSCDILNLSVGPVHLDLLGLVVDLDDCSGGPVTIDVTAQEDGGLLGDLLCQVAGLLDGGLDLGDILAGLSTDQLNTLTGGVRDLLNSVLDEVLAAPGGPAGGHQDGRCDILNLEIPEGLHLNLLGLQVDTSPICLDVFAQEGPDNLLGNLLCSLTDLLDNRGNNAKAERVLVRNILRLLDRLGL